MNLENKNYRLTECAWFKKVSEQNGGLSNMAAFPLEVNNIRILNSEALYQVCRYPNNPEIQAIILKETSPMSVKMKSKHYRKEFTRDNFGDNNDLTLENNNRIEIMRWCLRVKLACNYQKFGRLLLNTGNLPIVENAPTKAHCFWGAFPSSQHPEILTGKNVLGQLLTELRDEYRQKVNEKNTLSLLKVEPLNIPDFKLLGKPIETVDFRRR